MHPACFFNVSVAPSFLSRPGLWDRSKALPSRRHSRRARHACCSCWERAANCEAQSVPSWETHRMPDSGILLLPSTDDRLSECRGQTTRCNTPAQERALAMAKGSRYCMPCFVSRYNVRKNFSLEGTTDPPDMSCNSIDRSDRPSLVSKLVQAARRRSIKLVCVALTIVSSFAAFGTHDVDAATYVRVRYHGGYYNGYPYRYSGYYRYRGGIYRHRYYRYGRWYYY
jgi:hypothetical protein